MIPNQPFKKYVIEIAKQAQILLERARGGGTDAGRIHVNAKDAQQLN